MKKLRFPVLAIFRDTTIDCGGESEVSAPMACVLRGRTLTLKNIGTREGSFTFQVPPRFFWIRGNVRVEKKATEMTPEELREVVSRSTK